MKKRIVRLTESDIELIVNKVIKENDWDETGFERSQYSSEGDYLDSLGTHNENDVYLTFYYATGEEDYDDPQYVEGLIMSHMPRKMFIDIMGVEPEINMEIEPFNGNGRDLLRVITHGRRYLSIDPRTGKSMEPDIEDGWTQGVIKVTPFKEWLVKYKRGLGSYYWDWKTKL